MFDLVGILEESKEKITDSLERYRVNKEIQNILANSGKLSESQIEKCIIGLSAQGIYDITTDSEYLCKEEVLLDCAPGINKETFIKKVYKQNDSFLIFKKVLSHLKNSKKIDLNQSKLNINIHPYDLLHTDFTKELDDTFGTEVDLSHLTFEILEETIHPDYIEEIRKKLKEYKSKYNFNVSLDDFDFSTEMIGTYLELCLLLDDVKIDKDAFHRLKSANRSRLSETINFFQKYGKKIVIEGIETNEDLKLAESLGADFGQGFVFSKEKIKL